MKEGRSVEKPTWVFILGGSVATGGVMAAPGASSCFSLSIYLFSIHLHLS